MSGGAFLRKSNSNITPVKFDVAPSCPDCNSKATKLLGRCQSPIELSQENRQFLPWLDSVIDDTYFYLCPSCRLRFRFPALDDSDLDAVYHALPDDHWNEIDNGQPQSWRLARRMLLREFGGSRRPAVVDVGSFTGGFLDCLPSTWEKAAIEPSDSAREVLKAKGVNVIGGFLQEIKEDEYLNRFDAVVMTDVLEHMRRPSEALDQVFKLLKPSGVVLVSTGSCDHWTWRILGGHHWYLHTILHLSVTNGSYYRNLCRGRNWKIHQLVKHSHKEAGSYDRFLKAIEVLFYWSRFRHQVIRKTFNLLVRVPRFGFLKHRSGPPISNVLNDHLLVMIKNK